MEFARNEWHWSYLALAVALSLGPALGQSGFDGESTSSLIEQLKSDDPAAREDAAMALLTAGEDAREAWPALVLALTDDERLDCAVAARALFTAAPKMADVSSSIAALKFDTKARSAAAWEICGLGPSAAQAAPALIEALASEDKHARNFAVVALAMVGPTPEAVPALVKVMKDVGSLEPPQMNYRYPRASAAIALGLMGADAKQAVPALVDMLKGEDASSWEYHRAAAAFALGEIGPDAKEAAPVVMRALKDPSPVVQRWAARALAGISEPPDETVAALVATLSSDAGRQSRAFTRRGLRALAASEATWKPVSKGGRKQALPVHESIAVALGYLNSLPDAPTPAEVERQQGKYSKDVVRYFMALGGIQQGIASTLLEALGDEKRAARCSAAKALGRRDKPGKEAVAALEKALSDWDWMVRCAAAEALRRIRQEESADGSEL
jgi:HEAT repeat protein